MIVSRFRLFVALGCFAAYSQGPVRPAERRSVRGLLPMWCDYCQLECKGLPSAYPEADCTPTTAFWWNSSSEPAPA